MPFIGLLILYSFIYLNLHQYFPGAKLFVILGTVLVVVAIFKKPKIVPSKINVAFLLLVCVFFISIPFSSYIKQSLIFFFDSFIKMSLVAFVTYALLDSTKRLSVFAYAWLAYNSYLALNTLGRYGMSAINLRVGASGLAASSFFGDANDFALALNIALPFAWFLMLHTKAKIFKGLLLFSAVLLIMGVVVSGSRGGFITLSLTIIWIILSKSKRKLGALIVAVGIITAILALAPQSYISRIQTITGSALEEGDTGYGRITLWQAGLEMMFDNPITGVGITRYQAAYGNKYHREGDKKWRVAHNTYITIGAETGLIGLLLYLYLLYTIFKENLDLRKALRANKMEGHFLSYFSNALFASLFAYCIGSLFLNVWYYIHIYFMLALTVAIKRILVENYRFKIMNNKERNIFRAQVVTD